MNPRTLSTPLIEPGPAVGKLGWREIWRRPLPRSQSRVTRWISRTVIAASNHNLLEIRGLEHVSAAADPFVFVANHSQRLEALLVPALLIYHREGKLVHFMADWPTRMVPFGSLIFRGGEVIVVTSKRARFRWLNRFKPQADSGPSAFDQALAKLRSGASVGVFPEATMNRHPRQLLRGQTGAARLALFSGVPVVPAGIRFPTLAEDQPISDWLPMTIEIGAALRPPEVPPGTTSSREAIQAFHADVMREISRLSGKQWSPNSQRRRHHVPQRSAHRS